VMLIGGGVWCCGCMQHKVSLRVEMQQDADDSSVGVMDRQRQYQESSWLVLACHGSLRRFDTHTYHYLLLLDTPSHCEHESI
jgi:hypothetical protein